MKVLKFGGTSVGSADRMKNVAKIIGSEGGNIVVLSAMSGTTNALIGIAEAIAAGKRDEALSLISELENKYAGVIEALYDSEDYRAQAREAVGASFVLLRTFPGDKEIVAQGELMSTRLFTLYLHSIGVDAALLPALDYMRIDENGEPDLKAISEKLAVVIDNAGKAPIYITQGFICRNACGEIDNLKRGGSDYSASLIGAAVGADEIEIWTDIDGMHNNDPRFVDHTAPVKHLHFEEAAELAYFGAKILHPTCILPAREANIPVRLLNTMEPAARGTLIDNHLDDNGIKAVAAKDNITAIKIKSGRMLLAYGFLRKVFEIFETYRTPIDMIVTSEVGVSVTIDDCSNLQPIVAELEKLGSVTVDTDMVIICIAGDLEWQHKGFEASVLDALRDIPVRMISYGGSNYNISVLVKACDKVKALNLLSSHLFNRN